MAIKPKPKPPEEKRQTQVELGDAPQVSRMFTTKDGQPFTYTSSWSSSEKFARHIKSIKKSSAWHPSGWEQGEKQFRGTDTFEEAIQLAEEGWKEGVAKVSALQQKILANNPLLKEPIKYDVVGAVPNVPRAISGDPKNMRAVDLKKSRRRPVITIVANMSASWNVNEQILCNRAAAIAAVVDKIEASGFAVEVVAAGITGTGKFTVCTSITLKESHQPVDIARLAYGLGHSSFFRRLVFADWGGNDFCKPLGHGLGYISDMTRSPDCEDQGMLILPCANTGMRHFKDDERTEKDGVDFIIEVLKSQGCPAFTGKPDPRFEKDLNGSPSFWDDD